MKKKRQGPINNAIVISDTHIGCQLGLSTPSRVTLDGGGTYEPSRLQKVVWNMWESFFGEWVPMVTRGEDYVLILNGDATDGRHHNATTQITQNLADQQKMAEQILRPQVEKAAKFFMVRGTSAHVGETAENEERLAKALGAVPDEEGHCCRPELWLKLGKGLVHFLHHIGTSGSMTGESTALMKEYADSCAEAGRWGLPAPHVVVRSHRHRHAEIRVPSEIGYGTVFTTAGWQLKTPFVFKIAGARVTTPQIGGSLIRWGDEELYTRHRTWNIERTKTEIVTV